MEQPPLKLPNIEYVAKKADGSEAFYMHVNGPVDCISGTCDYISLNCREVKYISVTIDLP